MPQFNDAKQVQLAAAGVNGLTHLDLYTGPPPSSGNAAPTGDLLVSIPGITWNSSANPAVLSNEPSAIAEAGGVAGWGRFRSADSSLRMDALVGDEITIEVDEEPNATIVEGGRVTLVAASLTQPAGEL